MKFVRSIFAVHLALCLAAAPPGAAVYLDVPYVRQSPEACGEASLSMLMDYWKQHGASIPASADPYTLHQPGGVPAASMAPFLKRNGFEAFAFAGVWADIEKHLAQGRPLIVAFDGGTGRLHYAVVAGIGDATISLNDPADRKLRQYNRADFEQKWSASQRWTLLAVPTSVR